MEENKQSSQLNDPLDVLRAAESEEDARNKIFMLPGVSGVWVYFLDNIGYRQCTYRQGGKRYRVRILRWRDRREWIIDWG